MAIYSFSAHVLSRSKGHRATAAAAYRAGVVIDDNTIGERFDYSRKRGVVYSEILAPDHAPDWVYDRTALWTAVESKERRCDSQLSRDIMLALPHELDRSDQIELVRGFLREEFVARGMVADFSIHAPSGFDDRNWHAHIMLTLRPLEGDGFGNKAREWNRDELLSHWREAWASHANTMLEDAGFDARIDHRSLADQDVERLPGRHKGKAATAEERHNEEMAQLVDELAAIDRELEERERQRLDEIYGPVDIDIEDEEERWLEEEFGAGDPEEFLTREERLQADADGADTSRAAHDPAAEEAAEVAADAAPFIAQMRKAGEVTQHGLAVSWWEHAAHFATRLYDTARQFAAGLWDGIAGRER